MPSIDCLFPGTVLNEAEQSSLADTSLVMAYESPSRESIKIGIDYDWFFRPIFRAILYFD